MRRFSLLLVLLAAFAGCSPRYSSPPPPRLVGIPPSQRTVPVEIPKEPVAPVKKALIVVDAGHGGDDIGTSSLSKPRYEEKSLTLVTARFVKDYLKQMGYQVQMTRNDDIFIPLQSRSAIANEYKSALFVSIHYNSAPSKEAQGVEVFYYQSSVDKARTKASKELAAVVLEQVTQTTQAKSRGVKKGDFAVIRETKMPAILIEGGFLTNQTEMDKIKTPSYLKRIAWGVAQGVDSYIKGQNT